MVVRGGGSAAASLADAGSVARAKWKTGEALPDGIKTIDDAGTIAPGQTAAQSDAHIVLQQSMSLWPDMPDMPDDVAAIGQFADGVANAGPDTVASERASQTKRNRRDMSLG